MLYRCLAFFLPHGPSARTPAFCSFYYESPDDSGGSDIRTFMRGVRKEKCRLIYVFEAVGIYAEVPRFGTGRSDGAGAIGFSAFLLSFEDLNVFFTFFFFGSR